MDLHMKPKERLEKALKAFTVKHLFQYAFPVFPEVPREELTDVISRNRLETSKSKIIGLFMNLLEKKEVNNEECDRRTVLLRAKAVAVRPQKYLWVTLHLEGEPDMFGLSDSAFQGLISRSLRRNGIEAIVQVFHHSSAFWFGIAVKKLVKKKLTLLHPVIWAFHVDQPYMFVISKKSSKPLEMPVVEALGFVSYTKKNLMGHDIKSMLEICLTKSSRPEVVRTIELADEPMESEDGTDFTQDFYRKKYMKDLFPSDTPKMSAYSVECKSAPWHAGSSFPELADSTYRMRLRFKTKDTIDMFNGLAEEGFLEMPVPSYVSDVFRCARNDVKIRVVAGSPEAS